jgi:hypothetical protein
MNELKTGDLLLFSEFPSMCLMSALDYMIKCCTCSKYSHAALIVVDPPWAPSLKGTFVWESSWHGTKDPQDDLVKLGVQLTPLQFYTQQYPGSVAIYVRKGSSKYFTDAVLKRVHKMVYKHKYDDRPKDWLAACFKRKIERQTEVFTCSAFVSYVLTSIGVLSLETDWTIMSAASLSKNGTDIVWNVKYGRDTYLGTYSQRAHPKSNDMAYQYLDGV